MTARRLSDGGRIDRNRTLTFRWNKNQLRGFQGDTLASALLANNQWLLARSFKYHRPRGVMSAGVEESGALLHVGEGAHGRPNIKATTQELYAGLIARSQNAWPTLTFDLGSINNLLSRFFSAGFYYKTFMGIPPMEWGRGTWAWMFYEKLIRQAAGMGKASMLADPDCYEHAHAFCDVLVVGSGPAGRAAAMQAVNAGLEVWLVEQDSEAGGDCLSSADTDRQAALQTELQELAVSGVRVLARTTAFGLYDNNVAGLLERVTDHLAQPPDYLPRQRLWILHSKHIVLATGAIERSIAFGNNDLPGTLLAGAARSYLQRYAVLTGEKVVVATNNDSAYPVAERLASAGAGVTLLDTRRDLDNKSFYEQALCKGVDVQFSSAPFKGVGRRRITSLDTAVRSANEWRTHSRLDTDCLLVSGGWSPVVHLISHRGIKPEWDAHTQAFVVPAEKSESITLAGSAAGFSCYQTCQNSGEWAGQRAAKALGAVPSRQANNTASGAKGAPSGDHCSDCSAGHEPLNTDRADTMVYEIRIAGQNVKSFVDFEHDVTTDDLRLALQEGFESVEHLKRYTTLGMATDQGKMGNVPGIALMADTLSCQLGDIGTTTFRPPYTPIALGALAGRQVNGHFKLLRRTPMHQWNLHHGAVMTEVGLWQRPWYFPLPGENLEEAYVREAGCVRQIAGLCDITTLGKIQLQGPDTAEFLERIYTNSFASLPIGRARYGIMLRDDGMVMDDGTTWRLSEHDYFMTTTTAHAGKVMVWLEELLQCRWPELRVQLSSVTDQWAGISLAGPESRQLLSSAVQASRRDEIQALAFMGVVSTCLSNGVPCRVARISFSGELAYEVYTPSGLAESMIDLLWGIVREAGGCLYGLEALGTLRIEKGHVTGAELDGRVTIDDAGLGSMASTKKSYIGSVLRQRPQLQQSDRAQLVGVFPVDSQDKFNSGSLLFAAESFSSDSQHGHGQGWVTGVTHSPIFGHWIGIGFARGGYQAWQGKTLFCADPVRDRMVRVKLVAPHMYDPSGERQRV